MSAENDFRCPVCRAKQTLRETCRRCEADLSLVVRARQRLAYVKDQLAQARAEGNGERERQLVAEVEWLDPSV